MRGLEKKAMLADGPAEGEWFGVLFRLGVSMPFMRWRDVTATRKCRQRDRLGTPSGNLDIAAASKPEGEVRNRSSVDFRTFVET